MGKLIFSQGVLVLISRFSKSPVVWALHGLAGFDKISQCLQIDIGSFATAKAVSPICAFFRVTFIPKCLRLRMAT